MTETKNSNYYFEQAEICLRWSRVANCREAAALEQLASEYIVQAERLRSIEHAPFREQASAH